MRVRIHCIAEINSHITLGSAMFFSSFVKKWVLLLNDRKGAESGSSLIITQLSDNFKGMHTDSHCDIQQNKETGYSGLTGFCFKIFSITHFETFLNVFLAIHLRKINPSLSFKKLISSISMFI